LSEREKRERERERERWSLAVCRSAGGSSTSLRGRRRTRRRICTTTTVYYNYSLHSSVLSHHNPSVFLGNFCVIRSKMVIMQIWLQERNENIFLKQHLSILFWVRLWPNSGY
jgi:hypothetical protein